MMYPLLLILSLILSTSLHAATGGGLVADNTAGTLSTLQDQIHVITGGTVRGGNLLHSFREFNVETGQTADFQAAADTQNIVSRVTGPNDSWIDGQIKSTTSDANLYLVNPNGIVMGQNARLDVNGAFHATTADYVTLADGQRVYADANEGMTLTVAAPEAFGFLDASVGKIRIEDSQLRVAEGQAISLVGGEIDITSDAKLQAAGGRVDLVGVASAGEVKPASDTTTHAPSTLANITLTDSTVTVDNSTDSKTVGTIRVQGADITANNSHLSADNNSAVDATGSSVELDATEAIRFTDSQITAIVNSSGKGGSVMLDADDQISFSGADILVDANGTGANAGDAGDLTLNSRGDIGFTDVAQLNARTFGAGQGGDVTLTAAGQVYFADANDVGYASGILVRTESTEDGAGAGGKVTIQASDIGFAAGASITASTEGPGQGGSVSLDADNQIAFQNAGVFVGAVGTGANAGDAGDLTLQARDIGFIDGAQLDARTFGAGQGGYVTLTAAGQVYFADANDAGYASGILVRTESTEDGAGAGGKVTIQASDIGFAAGASITASTAGPGAGGKVTIQASDIGFAAGASITASTAGLGQGGSVSLDADNQIAFQNADVFVGAVGTGANAGDAGDLTLQARDIGFINGAQLDASTFGAGQGGDVTLTAAGQVSFAGANDAGYASGILVRTESTEDGAGAGGKVTIQASDIGFVAGARITATTAGPGQGGSVSLDADNQIAFQNADVFVGAVGTGANAGDAGDLTLQARDIGFIDGAQLDARTFGAGQGGDVTLTAAGLVSFAGANDAGQPSGIFVRTESMEDDAGTGGTVTIQASDIGFAAGARIIASTKGPGQGSSVSLDADNQIAFQSGGVFVGAVGTGANAGDAGDLTLQARDIRFTTGAHITASTKGPGQGGTVSLDADNQIVFQSSSVFVNAVGTGANAGDAGDLMLNSRGDIWFTDVAQLSATTTGAGKGGDVTLTATGKVSFVGANDAGQPSGIFVRTESTEDDAGAGGNVTLQAQDIEFAARARISAITKGPGQGGTVSLDADNQISFQGASIFVDTEGAGANAGDAGDLTLKARDIRFTDVAQLSATTTGAGKGGDVTLTAAGQVSFVGANDAGQPSGISVRTESTEDNAGAGGRVTIQAQDIEFAAGAQLGASTLGAGKGGNVTLTATGQVSFAGKNDDAASGIFVRTESTEDNAGAGGKVILQAQDIEFAAGAHISAITKGPGQGGTVSLDADNQIVFQSGGVFVNAMGIGANAGDAGDLMLNSRGDIWFTDVAQLGATTTGAGKGGDVTLTATGQVSFAGENDAAASGIYVRTESTEDNAGAGGSVTIQAQDIAFAAEARISAITAGPGQGGSVRLDADNQIAFSDAKIFVGAKGTGANAGDAGALTLNSRGDIQFTDGAQLGASTLGAGKGGDVTLTAAGQVYFAGENDAAASGIFARTESTEDDAGAGGSVTLQARDIEFAAGARISAITLGPGQGGAVSLQANYQIRLGRDALLSADSFGTGAAGDLKLRAANLILAGAKISSGSSSTAEGAGSAGNLRIITGETIQLSGGSALTTASENAGGGGIHIETRDRLHLQDSKITTSVQGGTGQGGNIFIDPVFVILANSQIQANAHGGPGGNITLIADYLLRSGPTAIEASSALSTPGNIDVQAVAVDAGSLQVTDTPDPLDVDQWASVPCHLRRGGISRLIMAGYDAHPTPVDDLLSSLPLRALRPTEPLSVPTSAVHPTPHNLLAVTHSTTGCSRL